jgi:hypothetical protein
MGAGPRGALAVAGGRNQGCKHRPDGVPVAVSAPGVGDCGQDIGAASQAQPGFRKLESPA